MKKTIVLPQLDLKRVQQFTALVRTLPIASPLNFYSLPGENGSEIIAQDDYPPLHAPWAIDFFFLAGIHNFGFWHGEQKHEGPLFGTLHGKQVKGSDLLWKLFLRAFRADPASMRVEQLAVMTRERWASIMSDDHGIVSLLATDERLALTRAYGKWFATPRMMGSTEPAKLILYANDHQHPLEVLRLIIMHHENGIPGYHKDPLQKKALLLLMALANRPEHFIVPEKSFTWEPLVDYHLMRLALRLGLVTLPKEWVSENCARTCTSPERERALRKAVFEAVRLIIAASGRSMFEIDNLMWSARRFCPEVEQPNCAPCMLQSACAQKVELFQPVIRTTAY